MRRHQETLETNDENRCVAWLKHSELFPQMLREVPADLEAEANLGTCTVVPCIARPRPTPLCLALPCLAPSYHSLSYPTLSYPFLSYLSVLSCRAVSCLVMSCPVLSRHVLSGLVQCTSGMLGNRTAKGLFTQVLSYHDDRRSSAINICRPFYCGRRCGPGLQLPHSMDLG